MTSLRALIDSKTLDILG